ncbi:MAG: AAA family ATPase [Crocosphaera sp.]|nr:AAA family ATPase [Crocosphaera sp.]
MPENLAVFIGWNGSGKTTILDGVYILLLGLIKELFDYKGREADKAFSTYQETQNDLDLLEYEKYRKKNLYSLLRGSKLIPDLITDIDNIYNKNNYLKIKIILFTDLLSGENPFLLEVIKRENLISSDFKQWFPKGNTWEETFNINEQSSVPIIAYYQYSSLKIKYFSNINFPTAESYKYFEHIPPMLVYKNSLMTDFDDYNHFIEWFKQQEDKENEEIRIRKDFDYRNNNLEIIRNSLEGFLTHLNYPNDSKFSDLRIIRTPSNQFTIDDQFTIGSREMIELTISKDDIDLKISQLSDGEKKCILIVADIARRLAIANPSLEVSDILEKGKGIILIDEIEAHLHPGWQREIIPALTQTFPSCQFIVTTHSPQVLSKVKKENIFVLEDGKVYPANHTYGRDSNSILSETMGIPERPIEIKEKLDECFDLIDDNLLEEAKAKLEELSDLLGHNDSEIVKANTTIDFIERIE